MNIKDSLKQSAKNSMDWLIHGFQKHGQGGFPHSRWMFLPSGIAWQKDYPETSGYLIENLLQSTSKEVHAIAISCAQWLCTIQAVDGFYHSGVRYNVKSAFNTAQILFGLQSAYEYSGDPLIYKAIEKAHKALIENINAQGHFKSHLYRPGYFATYYSRCIWPLLKIDLKYFDSINRNRLETSLNLLFQNKNKFDFFNNCGFDFNRPALSHPVAYALEGFYESAILTNNQEIEVYILEILSKISVQVKVRNKIPGYYNIDLSGEYSFICVTGQIQMCLLLLKAYQRTQVPNFKKAVESLLPTILSWQIQSNSKEHQGAFPSSIPIWGSYFPFRYTNWTVKFFLDLCQLWEDMEMKA